MTFKTRLAVGAAAAILLAFAPITSAGAQAPKEPEKAVLSGAPLGSVTLSHQAHTKTYGAKCGSCHHASKPEKALKADHEKCSDCHTKVATPPMKTKTQAAFHDPMAKKGVCVDCHVQAAAKGSTKVPAKCADCHKK